MATLTPKRSRQVCIVGQGVMGLSIAHDFRLAGDAVTVVADRSATESVSAVAAALWFPFHSGASPSLSSWLLRSRVRFEQLAADPATGVDLRPGLVIERLPGTDRSWTQVNPDHREATPDELPPGAVAGVRATAPVITTPSYLAWLRRRCEELGVRFVERTVAGPNELADEADLVVIAAGLRSGDLLGDDALYPIRGQVVRLANPGITDWLSDDDNPAGLTYIIPRRDDIVCGGVEETGSWSTEVDAATERAILERATALLPALAGLPVLSRAAGLRPARKTIRLEYVAGHQVPVIACYGHGGSGFTLSWGCAEAVVELASA